MADVEVSSMSGEVLARLQTAEATTTAAAVREAVDPKLPESCARVELVQTDGLWVQEDTELGGKVVLNAVLCYRFPTSYLRRFVRRDLRGEDREGNEIYDVRLPAGRAGLPLDMWEMKVPSGRLPTHRQQTWRDSIKTVREELEEPVLQLKRFAKTQDWHPHLARLFGAFLEEPTGPDLSEPAWVRVFVRRPEGRTVRQRIEDDEPFTVADVQRYASQVTDAVRFLHEREMPHGGLCDQSIRISGGSAVLIAPSGSLRKAVEQVRWLHKWEFTTYMDLLWAPPEYFKFICPDELSFDIWALGCAFLEMSTGNPPWHELMKGSPYKPHTWNALMHVMETAGPDALRAERVPEEALAFLSCIFVDDFLQRPLAQELVAHPFLLAPQEFGACVRDE